jgi:hypothetical protein
VFDLQPGAYEVPQNGRAVAGEHRVKDRDFSLGFRALGKHGDRFSVTGKRP